MCGMARKKKPFRDVRDRNFLEIANMPLVENKSAAIEWIKTSKVMGYVFQQARSWNFLVASYSEDDGYVWHGVNYGEENRKLNRETKTAYGKKVFDALTRDKIDLMPLLRYRDPEEEFSPLESEVIQFLATKKHILNLVFITATYNGRIIVNKDGTCIGQNML